MTVALADAIRAQWATLPHWPIPEDKIGEEPPIQVAISISDNDENILSQLVETANTTTEDPTGAPPVLSKSNPTTESIIRGTAHGLAAKLAEIEARAWESLNFPIMTDREDEIAEAELATFDWIFKKPRSGDRPWSNFLEWLQSGDSLYWINGKPGSGKSTLMKHLFNHRQTSQALKLWAGDMSLVTASFFFWYSGGNLQKSQIGLLRSLLYQCLKNRRELVPVVLTDPASLRNNQLADHWTLPQLKRAFTRLLQQDKCPLRMCIFVDGLDEYHGDHLEIAELFKVVIDSKHVKVCVSSRPLLVFDRAFGKFPGLSLQNLTFEDIGIYVRNRLSHNERMRELQDEEPELASQLVSEILNKAAGVFLWVKLVVHSLLEGLSNFDRGIDLKRRLQELPNDLEDLYWHILDRVKPAWYLEEGFRLLLLVKTAQAPLTLRQLCFADIQEPDFAIRSKQNEIPWEKQEKMCLGMEGRIKSRCLGLLELSSVTKTRSPCKRTVQFLHKSVKDFLETPKAQLRISECLCGKAFNAEVQLMGAFLLELKHSQEVDRMSRGTWFDDIRPLIKIFMEYARCAELNSYQPEVALVDELDRVAGQLWDLVVFRSASERQLHWSRPERRPIGADDSAVPAPPKNSIGWPEIQPNVIPRLDIAPTPNTVSRLYTVPSSFMSFATSNGLENYVRAKGCVKIEESGGSNNSNDTMSAFGTQELSTFDISRYSGRAVKMGVDKTTPDRDSGEPMRMTLKRYHEPDDEGGTRGSSFRFSMLLNK